MPLRGIEADVDVEDECDEVAIQPFTVALHYIDYLIRVEVAVEVEDFILRQFTELILVLTRIDLLDDDHVPLVLSVNAPTLGEQIHCVVDRDHVERVLREGRNDLTCNLALVDHLRLADGDLRVPLFVSASDPILGLLRVGVGCNYVEGEMRGKHLCHFASLFSLWFLVCDHMGLQQ